ncbi:dipeptide epimerase [Olivibacter ginsenosidimutans]|uniref:Dipeptide epimerase n=2 Tax=Olivibacter ginsenosidimutans TaxID=1176537 RepID=A0ABP9AEU0_9SPHI
MRHPFRIADNVRTGTPLMLIKLSYKGYTGYGEASMPPRYGEDLNTAQLFLEKVDLNTFDCFPDLSPLLSYIDGIAPGNAAIKAALDIALHDLLGKFLKQPVHQLYHLPAASLVTAQTITIEAPEIMAQRVKEATAFRYLKVKLGTSHDRTLIEAIRRETDKPLYIDANQGWKDPEIAIRLIEWLSEQNCVFIEQPLPKNDYEGMYWLKERSPLPLIGDEGIQRFADLETASSYYHGINVKLMKSTGIKEAFEMLMEAKRLGLQTMIGCMSETSCAISAAAQLGSLADYIDLDGNLGVTNDPFTGFICKGDVIPVDETPGIGLKHVDWNRIVPFEAL